MNGKLAGVMASVVAAAGVLLLTGCGAGAGSTKAQIQQTVKELNAKLPMQVDAVTRLDRVEGSGKNFSYHYTVSLTGLTKSDFAQLQRSVTAKAKSSREMKPIFDAGVTVWYKYHDSSGKLLHEFAVR